MIHSYIISSKLAELSPSPHSLQQHQMCPLRVQAALVRHQWSSLSKQRQSDTWTIELHHVVMLCFISQGCKNRLNWWNAPACCPLFCAVHAGKSKTFVLKKEKKKTANFCRNCFRIYFFSLWLLKGLKNSGAQITLSKSKNCIWLLLRPWLRWKRPVRGSAENSVRRCTSKG